jgi:hypothetical protein
LRPVAPARSLGVRVDGLVCFVATPALALPALVALRSAPVALRGSQLRDLGRLL